MRCFGTGDPLYERYHDEEWGRPVVGERALFERITLEAFQSGLAWITILRKRDAFRAAFASFDPEAVAAFGEQDIEQLLGDAGIVRNRAKIEAAIANARAILVMRERGERLEQVVWSHATPAGAEPPADWTAVEATTPASRALARDLKARGFRFVGPTTAYASMQACGLVNDHLATCPVREAVEADRAAATLPC
jgi:DNA-3-methyladenine glycosylase I